MTRTYHDLCHQLILLVTNNPAFKDIPDKESMIKEWKELITEGWYDSPEKCKSPYRFGQVTNVLNKHHTTFNSEQDTLLKDVVMGKT